MTGPDGGLTREQYETIVDALDAIVCELDGTTLQFRFVSKGAEKILGYPTERWLELDFWIEHVHPDDRVSAAKAKREIVARREKRRIEYRMISANGGVVWIRDMLTGAVAANNDALLYGVKMDVTAEKEAEDQLRESRRQLRALADRLIGLREDEAARIGREIHDEMGQALTTLKIEVQALEKKLREASRAPDDADVYEKLDAMSASIDSTAEITRRIVTELRPSVLDQLGLVAALEWQAQEFEARTGIFCNLTLPEVDFPLDDPRRITVFRIFQEVLTNIARHSEASEVQVSLEQKSDEIILTVVDNGRGISSDEIAGSGSFGLLGMRERALAAGGGVEIAGEAGKGTSVVLRLPGP